ncbi:hypothetical protein ACOYR4_18670 [Acidovorax sp. M14]|uniref:hypothetical protein n=1 Tax=Acidovorax sp. M14 TaxID=3411354 RepID=UPI003BF4CFEE
MSGTWRIGPATALAQLQATIELADAGPGPSKIQLYTTARHSALDGAAGDLPQAEVVLAVPCASIVDGALVLHVADPDGTLVMATGMPRWGLWVNGAGQIVAEGSVTDEANGGDFWVAGGVTPIGETSPLLQAGGLVLLGTTSLT